MSTDNATKLEPLAVTVQEARRLTGLGNTTIYKLIGQGKLRVTKTRARRTETASPRPSDG
jgi:excisionase family DNA binding protein